MPTVKFVDLGKQYLSLRQEILDKFDEISKNGDYILSKEVSEFEENFAMYCGTKYAVGVGNGSDALYLSLLSLGIGPDDEVITAPNSFVATAWIIERTGARIVFCDVGNDMNINPDLIESVISERTKAILPVHLTGRVADMDRIQTIADKHDLLVLEDAAQGFGGEIHEKKAGSFGDVAATSFFPAKPLGCYGDGGAIFTNDDSLAEKMISIRVHGSGSDKYDNVRLGLNGRLDTLQAAILLEKLAIFPEEIVKRNDVAEYYTSNLSSHYKTPDIPDGYISAWAQYSVLAGSSTDRDSAIEHLKSHNIPAMIYYKISLHQQEVFSDLGCEKGDYPVSEECSEKIFSIPMHPYIGRSQQDEIIEMLNSCE